MVTGTWCYICDYMYDHLDSSQMDHTPGKKHKLDFRGFAGFCEEPWGGTSCHVSHTKEKICDFNMTHTLKHELFNFWKFMKLHEICASWPVVIFVPLERISRVLIVSLAWCFLGFNHSCVCGNAPLFMTAVADTLYKTYDPKFATSSILWTMIWWWFQTSFLF